MQWSSKQSKPKSVTRSGQSAGIDHKRKRLFYFLGTFVGLLLIGSIIYPIVSIRFDRELQDFMGVTATICGKSLALLPGDTTISGRFVTFNGFSIEIIEECTGLMEMLIFLAALLSYPASWKSKAIGLLLGVPVLYLFNVVRIIFLTIVGAHFNSMFKFMHLYFWQATLILMITGIWVLWIVLVVNRDSKSRGIFA